MDKRFRAIIAVAVVVILAILGLAGYFAWLNITHVDTLKAQIKGQVVEVRGPAMARVEELGVELGDPVMKGEQIALLRMVGTEGTLLIPLLAPVNGVVAYIAADPGDTLAAGQTLLTLVNPERVWVSADIHQSRAPQVRIGQRVRVRVFTRTKRRIFWGRVEQVGAATAAQVAASTLGSTGTMGANSATDVPVIISVDSEGYPLLPGMRAEVRIQLESRPRLW
ncbi:MAG: HlyD family efflux transporter periplasmic adaptor subunit [Chloroflexi bacterium]|nr:HlyD family efflux transporter periplasmic adaptor subunit [Chloroflexota bacterium]